MAQVETYRGFVYPWNIDHVGHMNVQFYVGKFDEASWNFLAGFGITPNYLKENNRGVVAAEQNIKYQQEVVSGSLLVVRSYLVEVKSKVLKYKHIMYNGETNEQVAEMLLTVIHIDAVTRKSCDIPKGILSNMRETISPLVA